jgi:biotin-independent malonate decarboxylase beta subunit
MDQRKRSPQDWLTSVADDGHVTWLHLAGPSPHLPRYGIATRDDDGILCASLAIDGQRFLVAAQDASFLSGSVGQRHGERLATLLREARVSGTPVLLLLASGGVRLHEANPGEVALASALRELILTRAAEIPVLAVAIGDVFGGASVLACAATRFAMIEGTRLGLSGPKVIATMRGVAELDPDDGGAIDALLGVAVRVTLHVAERVRAESYAVRAWTIARAAAALPFADAVQRMQDTLAERLVKTMAPRPGDTPCAPSEEMLAAQTSPVSLAHGRAVVAPFAGIVEAQSLVALDARLLALPSTTRTLVLREDSEGHEASRAAELLVLSQYLAHHACVLGLLRRRGVTVIGVLEGTGHSAAFFAHALQADRLYVLPDARVVAMAPQALARVIGVTLDEIVRHVENDVLLGHPARHLVALGAAVPVADWREAL